MATKTLIRHFALDTSFIEGQNFLAGKLLHNLADLAKKNHIKIYMTDIIYREVLARFEKRLLEEEKKIEGVKKTIESSVRVLKNFKDYSAYFTLPELKIEEVLKNFRKDFYNWVKSADVKILKTDHMTIGKVMDDYFNAIPPFGEGNKKSEFPDAFNFQALELHFAMGKIKCYFVTADSDFDEIKSTHIIPTKDLPEKLDLVIREEEKKSGIIKLIEKAYHESKATMEVEAKALLTSHIEDEVEGKGEINGMLVDVLDRLEITEMEFKDYKIVYSNDHSAQLQCEAVASYELTIALEDNSSAFYDKEDDIYYGTQQVSFDINDTKEIEFDIVIDFDLESSYTDASVEDLIVGNDFDIFDGWEDNDY